MKHLLSSFNVWKVINVYNAIQELQIIAQMGNHSMTWYVRSVISNLEIEYIVQEWFQNLSRKGRKMWEERLCDTRGEQIKEPLAPWHVNRLNRGWWWKQDYHSPPHLCMEIKLIWFLLQCSQTHIIKQKDWCFIRLKDEIVTDHQSFHRINPIGLD